MRQIRGSGGGGKGGGGGEQRAPVESPDSLRSRQYARVLDLVSEGEIGGLVNGLQSVFLDETPVQNSDGSYNFNGVTLDTRVGTQSQGYIPGFGAVEAETAVAVPVTVAAPVVRSISNPNANAVRVTVSVPQLTEQNVTNGDLTGASAVLSVELQTAGGGYVGLGNIEIIGKTTSRYQRTFLVQLSGSGPWDIRLQRLTADSLTVALQNATYWDSYTEIIDAKLRYPNAALVALSVDAERFNNIPRRGYELLGLKVRIPSNYVPETRLYSGVWDGTFTTAWTNNPAWCFYDLLTANRYGLGSFIDASQVDKWALYEIGQYCDELVDDGFGGTEPRFTCNLYLQTREEAYNVITTFASIFCGLAYWAAGTVFTTQDAPQDPVALFTPANVIPSEVGSFNYTGSSIKARHTVALVTWNDPADRYRQKIEYVEDTEGIARYGIVQTEVVALGCSSRGQAHRFGRRILYSERMETEVISFRAGLDGLAIAPGQIIQTTDPVRAGLRLGGRLISATTSSVVLDAAVTIEPATAYTLWAILSDGSMESRAVSTAAGVTSNLSVSPAFTLAPQAMAVWVLAADNVVPETWRVVSVSEVDGTQAEISALAYRSDKYGAIEQGLLLEPLQTSVLNQLQAPPTDVVVTESLYLVTAILVGARITVSWNGVASYFELQYRPATGNWKTITTPTPSVDIQPVDPGVYEFVLTAVNSIGRRSLPVSFSKEVLGKSALPEDVTGFSIIAISGRAHAAFDKHPALDVNVGGTIIARHTPLSSGAVWEHGIILDEFDGSAVYGTLPLLTGTYMLKARDSSGNYSANSTNFVASESLVTGFTTVATSAQAPSFSGVKTGTYVDGVSLQLSGTTPVDDMLDSIDSWGFIDTLGGILSSGSYLFDAPMSFGAVASRRISAVLQALSFDSGDLVDDRGDIDSWDSVDGGVINDTDATLYYSTTQTDPAGSPVWGAWTPFMTADVTAWGVKYRLDLESGSPTHNIAISTATVIARSSP